MVIPTGVKLLIAILAKEASDTRRTGLRLNTAFKGDCVANVVVPAGLEFKVMRVTARIFLPYTWQRRASYLRWTTIILQGSWSA